MSGCFDKNQPFLWIWLQLGQIDIDSYDGQVEKKEIAQSMVIL